MAGLHFLTTAYMIVGKSGIIDVIPLSVGSRLLLLISLPKVSKLTFLHEVPAISNSVPVVSWILFAGQKRFVYRNGILLYRRPWYTGVQSRHL